MATPRSFAAQVGTWCASSEKRLTAVFRESTQRTVSIAQNLIPVDTGFARASVRASLHEMPKIDYSTTRQAKSTYKYDGVEVTAAIVKAKLGDAIYIGWTAAYAPELERGHSAQAPSGFIGVAAAQWPQTVDTVVRELRERASE